MWISPSITRQQAIVGREQVEAILAALFAPEDLIEVRAIETRLEDGKKCSRPLDRMWLSPRQVLDELPRLARLNERANIFFGVNPRTFRGGKKDDVAVCRSVWVDFDNITFSEATERWQRLAMPPSIVVNSGRGIHAYWLLDRDHLVKSIEVRTRFEAALRRLYRDLGADSVQDVSRLLRLPGFDNLKQGRVPCGLLHCDSHRRYPLTAFARWLEAAESVPVSSIAETPLPHLREAKRIHGLVRHLDRDVEDRSRRDFAVLCGLLNAGLSRDEIWSLVQNHSKFETHGESYFEITLQNALRRLRGL